MTASLWIRRAHRALSLAFTAGAVVNVAAWGRVDRADWIGFVAVVPLALLLLSGLVLFVLPYAARRRG